MPRRARRPWLVGAFVMVVAVAACAPEGRAGTSPTEAVSGGHGAAIFEVVTVMNASYGRLVIETAAGALCNAKALLPSGGTVIAGDFLIGRKVDADGRATWTYATPIAGAGEGSGRYEIACSLGGQTVRASAEFAVP